jgi:predicted nucleic acid-binding protein
LDTSVIIPLIRKEKQIVEKVREEASRGTRVYTTLINLCELYRGAFRSTDTSSAIGTVRELLERIGILEFSVEACICYGEKINQAPLKNEPIGDFDLIIACIAMAHGEALATRNIEHFKRIPGLVVQQW